MKTITIFNKSYLQGMPGKEKITWKDNEFGKMNVRGEKGRFCSVPVKIYHGKRKQAL